MREESTRLVDGSREPTEAELTDFIGKQNAARWTDRTRFIAANYPGVFNIECCSAGRSTWVFVSVDSAKVPSDIKQLLALKRPPKPGVPPRTRRVASSGRTRRATRG
jgi:hypothetical protein